MNPSLPSYVVCHARSTEWGSPIVEYLQKIDATLEPYGGRFLVHGGPVDVREGSWPGDLIMLEFPDHDAAAAWYGSAAYQAISGLRRNHSDSTVFIIDGVTRPHRATDIFAGEVLASDR